MIHKACSVEQDYDLQLLVVYTSHLVSRVLICLIIVNCPNVPATKEVPTTKLYEFYLPLDLFLLTIDFLLFLHFGTAAQDHSPFVHKL
mgnify:CR=1 FL=1